MTDVTYSEARPTLATLWERIVAYRDVVVARRRGKEPIAILPTSKLAGRLETAHLMRSPRNADRLAGSAGRSR